MAASASSSELANEVRGIAAPIANGLGIEIVEVACRRHGRRWLLRVDIDRPGPGGVGIEDCKTVSLALDPMLEKADVLGGEYVLEVSSPGVDRPIRTDDDWRRNTGRRLEVEASGGRFRGVLTGFDDQEIRILRPGEDEIRIARGEILRARQAIEF